MRIQHLTILNTREAKRLHEQLEQQYGYKGKMPYAFLQSNKDKVYIIHKDVDQVELQTLRVDTLGLYFMTLHYPHEKGKKTSEFQLRLSIEGSQLIGPQATKNVLDLTKEQTKAWFRGEDLEIDPSCTGFQIIRHQSDYLGCGKASSGKLYNYLPKTRRIVPEHTPNE
ncbi:MAG TPA: hypothetical protein VJG90_04665 [Candidatus Nanoarchaeia archaeon]|nr:hypothetical protein [Candidatus Nanoarchaeia archaeon]